MDLRAAYEEDKGLKEKFIAAIDGKWPLDAAIVSKSDRCTLGNWLTGEADRKFKFLKSYKPCLEAHEEFHTQAAKVARQINLGEYDAARAMLDGGTAFSKALAVLGSTLIQLKKDAKI
jgi:hypothetical protein